MWPRDPDDFLSLVEPPHNADPGAALIYAFLDGELVCLPEQGTPKIPTQDDFRWLDVEFTSKHYMGELRGQSCYAATLSGKLSEGYSSLGLRGFLGRVEAAHFYLAGRAQQIVAWHSEHGFCGRCGTATQAHTTDRAKVCPDCGLIAYPRLSPSIIVLIHRGEDVLLARNAQWPDGMFSTLAGFVEPGESIEQTVHREVKEEVGLDVTNLRYLGSQSWPFPNSLMLGFHAEYAGGDIVCQEGEIAEANWFAPDALPQIPPPVAISRWLIDDFLHSL